MHLRLVDHMPIRRAVPPLPAVPSALLSLAGRSWRALHSATYSLMEAALGLAAVALQYSRLARDCDMGRIPTGERKQPPATPHRTPACLGT